MSRWKRIAILKQARFSSMLVILLSVFLFATSSCRERDSEPVAPDPLATLTLSTNIVHIGDVFDAHLVVIHRTGSQVQAPDPDRDNTLTIRDRGWRTRELDERRSETTISYKLASFELGRHVLSTGLVQVIRTDGTTLDTAFPYGEVEVIGLLGEEPAQRGLKPPADWPSRFPVWIPVLLLIAVLALLLAGLAARWIKRGERPAPVIERPPAHEVALRSLRNLLARGWIEEGHAEPFYVELSGIVRTYLEDRFNLRAPEQTTEEFIRETASSQALSREQRERVSQFLEQSDLVKFARFRPRSETMRSAYESGEQLVLDTRPEPGEVAS